MKTSTTVGRLGQDPTIKTTDSGKKVANFTVAVRDRFNKDRTFWFRFAAWGKTADFVEAYCKKGDLVEISGEDEQRNYEHDGQKREAFQTNVNAIQKLEKRDAEAADDSAGGERDPFADD